MILVDAVIGSMIEPACIPDEAPKAQAAPKPWATNGRNGRAHKNVVNSLVIDPEGLREHNRKLQSKYRLAVQECRHDTRFTDDAEVLVVAYGVSARLALSACKLARQQGVRAALFRPITLYPYPSTALRACAEQAGRVLVVELSSGQMVEDVRLAVGGAVPVEFYGEMGGVLPSPAEICAQVVALARGRV
jgi:2-oxoglutarate ferredoxin oxidoreductase subunit alpha